MVAIFSISDKLGGAEQVLYKIAKHYSDKQIQVNIYFIHGPQSSYWKDTLINNVNIFYLRNNLFKLIRFLVSEQFNIVFSSHLLLNAILGVFRCFGILKTDKFVARESTQIFGRYLGVKLFLYKFAYWIGYRKIDLLICQSNRMLEALKRNAPHLTKRINIKVIPNPFDFPKENLIYEVINNNHDYIVAAGRLIPEKGFDILIKSFSYLIKDFPELKLIILGEGPERKKLEKLISDLSLHGKVKLQGHVSNVYPYFKSAKVCVVSSIIEGFPNVLLQMMSQNEKVVSTLCAGGIKNINNIETCPVDSYIELYKSIYRSITSDTTSNRLMFDYELEKRSIDKFVSSIEKNIVSE